MNLYNDDCLNVLKNIENESIDLVVTDCPYHIVSGGCTNIPRKDECGGMFNRRNAFIREDVKSGKLFENNDIEFKDLFHVIFKEFRIAILCAIVLGICNFFKMLIVDHVTIMVASVVCITLFITIIIAKLIGSTLPMLAKKIGLDPAVMASPFITTIVDACSLLIYFNVASIILGL